MPGVSSAQLSTGDARAFVALRASHIGALAPMMTPAMIGRKLNGAQLGVRYGLLDEGGVLTHGIAGSAIFGVGLQSSMVLTAGVREANCNGCTPALLLGLGGDMRVMEAGDVVGSGSSLSVAVSGDIGFAQLKPNEAIALGVGAPVTLTLGAGGRDAMRFVSYFTPTFGIGETNADCPAFGSCERTGTRWVLGGGIGLWNPMSNVSASIGINQVMLSGAQPVYGVNVVLGGR